MMVLEIFFSIQKHCRNCLLYNNGDGTFTDISYSAGLDGDSSWSFSATFADVNRDGYIDLYVGGFVDIPMSVTDSFGNFVAFTHTCYSNKLYLNNGNNTFTDVTSSMLVGGAGCTLSSIFTDYDKDGDADILNVNDFGAWVQPNSLYCE